jgi:endonuclease/exonuclease/phosphatase family metal-dependent hydrolase
MSLRVGTLNVHFFKDDSKVSIFDALVAVVKPLQLDVLVLQEVPEKRQYLATDFCAAIDLPFSAVSAPETCGNAILSRWPLIGIEAVAVSSVGDHARCLVRGFIEHPSGIFCAAALHLNHKCESIRLAQSTVFAEHISPLKAGGLPYPTLLAGDFNALTRDDYSDARWSEIAKERAAVGIESPAGDCVQFWADRGLIDVRRISNLTHGLMATCHYGTRIDYMFVNPEFLSVWWPFACWHTPTASDHSLVWTEFKVTQRLRAGTGKDTARL